jgi:ATP/ADP translocase/HEAT repeat protein
MTRLRMFWKSLFDVRPGEYLRTTCLTLYLTSVLFAYYILKPVSRAIFLNKFDIEKLPWLYVLIAAVGGVLAYFYTKMAVNSSLKKAVNIATIFAVGVLVAFWWLIALNIGWIVYAFNIWVSLFSIILVSQGWLIAANVFTSREAKRLYGILGVGSVIGAAFGGTFTAFMVRIIGTTNLILACAGMVVLSYVPFWILLKDQGTAIAAAKAAKEDEDDFSFAEILGNLRRHRHLQVIMAIMVVTFVIDVLVEYQFNAMAKVAYHSKEDLTAFLGNFYGFWLNLVTFIFQFFLTGFVVSRFGVGGTLQIMPASIALASIAALVAPSVLSTASARLTEASTRYSFNKTGMELLYLPLPLDLRNRTKAFVDVFVDRFARGLGGMLLVVVTTVLDVPTKYVALIVMLLAVGWMLLSAFAKKEYIATVRKRLEARRLDIESARVSMDDPGLISMLEQTAHSPNPRQATYALSLLNEASGYKIEPLLSRLIDNAGVEVRSKIFEIAAQAKIPDFMEQANRDIRSMRPGENRELVLSAVQYSFLVSPEKRSVAGLLLDHPNPTVIEGALKAIAAEPEIAHELIQHQWLEDAANSSDPKRRRLAALAVSTKGDQGTEVLHRLLNDNDPTVVEAAFHSAGTLKNREYVPTMVRRLSEPKLRGAAIEALSAYGDRIVGTLGDLLQDKQVPFAMRRQIPRVLRLIPSQRAVDILLGFINDPNLALRGGVLRALNRLRESAPNLDYGAKSVTEQVSSEARYYFELSAALEAFREPGKPRTPAALLASTLQERLKLTIERLFRLLGLRYPPRQVYAAYLAMRSGHRDEHAAALEFLDSVLDRDTKRILVPILDDPAMLAQRGRDLFGIQRKDAESALREMLSSGDEWLVSCAIATAAQLKLSRLVPDIKQAHANAGSSASPIWQVAQDAMAVLA